MRMISRKKHDNQFNGEAIYSYDNPLDQKLAIFCILRGINLTQVDDFLESFNDKDSLAFYELIRRRERARDGVVGLINTTGGGKDNSFPYSFNTILRDLEFIVMRMREFSMLEYASAGETKIKGCKLGGEKTKERTKQKNLKRNTKIKKEREELLKTHQKHEIASLLSNRYGLTATQIRNILKEPQENLKET